MPSSERNSKVTLASTFLGLLVAFSALLRRREQQIRLAPFDLVMLGLSTYRTGRLLAYERSGRSVAGACDRGGAGRQRRGETVVAAGSGWRWTPGELVSCPICIGTWVAAGLVYGLHLAPRPTRVFLAIMSATGVAQVLTETPEALTWTGRAARAQSTPPGDV